MPFHPARRVARLAAVAAGLSLAAVPVYASTVLYRTDAELIVMSERVVHARVLAQRPERPDPGGAIYTVTTMAVLEDFTGVVGDVIEVWELGGVLDGEFTFIGGAVKYSVGEEYLLMLGSTRRGLRSVAMNFSKFNVFRTSPADGFVLRDAHDTMVVGGRPEPDRSLAEFRALVRQVLGRESHRSASAEAMQPLAEAYLPYTLLLFDCVPPSPSGDTPVRWTQADSGTPVNWYKNTSAAPPVAPADGVSEIQTALAAWTAPASASIVLQYAGTTLQSSPKGQWTGLGDGNGVITFEDPNGEMNPGTLAIGGGNGFCAGGGTINGTNFARFTHGYVIFQNAADLTTQFKQSLGFSRVLEHEIGHTIGLGHTQQTGIPNPASNIMYFSCCDPTTPVPPAIGSDDHDGLNFIYPVAGVSCSYTLSPTSATATASGGSATVTVSAPSACAWTATSNTSPMLTVTGGSSGSGSGTVTYSVAANSSMSPRTGSLAIGGQSFTVTQFGNGPMMSIDKTSLAFSAVSNGSMFTSKTSDQTVRLTQATAGTVTWTAASNQPWLTVSPTFGTGSATLSIGVQFAGPLPPSGPVSGTVTLAFSGAGNSPGPINVNLTIVPFGASAIPFGVLDTPAEGSTGITGSIAVTGWALDDIEVSRVRILRDPVSGEGPALVFIGTAVFVEGSRTDITGFYPTYPRNTRAGWGYLLLTNFLPNQGNGTFRLFAYADDAEGNSTLLGSKTITCDNANAVKPFGTIDTPGQGATVSGTINNFGWALAPGGKFATPPNGGTVTVYVDGVPVGSPGIWGSRSDITALFPGYAGLDSAVGAFSLNTTTYANGVHTISWLVVDTGGQSDGIGSRFFTIANGALTEALTAADEAAAADRSMTLEANELMLPLGSERTADAALTLLDEVNAAPPDAAVVTGRRGYSLNVPFHGLRIVEGRATMYGEELDRFELNVGRGFASAGYTGYLRTPTGLLPLPIGSYLDTSTGTFTWQPGVGFVGTYDLVFVRWSRGRAAARQEVRIVLHPKASGRVGPQVMIDTPSPGASGSGRTQPILLAGWALDLDTDIGTGVDTLHVWAYPAGGGAPLFLGATAYGGERPDVGALFGAQFTRSGYGMWVDGLAPGTYDLAVFAWSTVQNRFVPAKVVRVTIASVLPFLPGF